MQATTEDPSKLPDAARAAWFSGMLASVFSAVALIICGKREENSAAGPLNGPSQWLWGEKEAYTRRFTLRHTVVGYGIHHCTSVGWATVHERAFGSSSAPKSVLCHCIEAAVTTAAAYVVDYHVTPSRLRPGFKKHLGPRSIFVVYACFAAGLAVATVLRQQRAAQRVANS